MSASSLANRANRVILSVIKKKTIKKADISALCNSCQSLMSKESTVISLKSPIFVVGDLHGSLLDLLKILCTNPLPPSASFLFLGDYVNKGPSSVEVICVLLSLKALFPANVFLLRGNHETDVMGRMFGFFDECQSKLSKQIYTSINKVFDVMPLAAVIDEQIFCVHGGISPELTDVGSLKVIKRPLSVPQRGLIADILWSDPTNACDEWEKSPRGSTYLWGKKALHAFLDGNNMRMMIRGHELVYDGVTSPFTGATTVFTASNYEGEYKNKAGIVKVQSVSEIIPIILGSDPPNTDELAAHFAIVDVPRINRT